MIDAVIFDMDGTLLNTLDDLANSVNYTLSQFGFPTHTKDEIKNSVVPFLPNDPNRCKPD